MGEFQSFPAGIRTRSEPVPIEVHRTAEGKFVSLNLLPNGSLVPRGDAAPEGEVAVGFDGKFATQGLIDLQVNGFDGLDFNRGEITGEQLDQALVSLAKTGVTALLPTIITGSPHRMVSTLRELDKAVSTSRLGPHMVVGYHIEGPFLSPKDGFSGAHNGSHMTAADLVLVDQLQAVSSRKIKLVTIAPEVDGAIEIIQALTERGTQVAIGHSAANADQISAAVEAGARLCTHLGNGLPQMLHKTDNPIFWQLADDRLTAMFIADGIHVPLPALQTMLRAKGPLRTILTTDAVAAAGHSMWPGPYTLGDAAIELAEDRSVRIPGSRYLAGSSVTMDQMVRNMAVWFDQTVPNLLQLMRENPLRFISDQHEAVPLGATDGVVEWETRSDEWFVSNTHIGPFTIE
ncbi:N-acetylglucosamine-6-phosphate deacetylase [Hoeflea sp. TYP-13]|uniref:N-acetylglucosamine-6-phosphate deacetylase n=1 Tax=Hoeflea sp. TYP-13 TaxID=3230023 RepID=UPI0034C63296